MIRIIILLFLILWGYSAVAARRKFKLKDRANNKQVLGGASPLSPNTPYRTFISPCLHLMRWRKGEFQFEQKDSERRIKPVDGVINLLGQERKKKDEGGLSGRRNSFTTRPKEREEKRGDRMKERLDEGVERKRGERRMLREERREEMNGKAKKGIRRIQGSRKKPAIRHHPTQCWYLETS